ncbi:MAG: hypothetical protein MJK04_03455, partial [Psychrosphaera sp.]|nr:hypothetical protein [Psychrosphaera sp.]
MLIFLIGAATASTRTFQTFGLEQGLSQLSVNTIVQDNQGFIWIGTNDGLNRYDGQSFTVFRNDPNASHSLAGNAVSALLFDDENNLWIMTSVGLDSFDRATGRFIHYTTDKFDKAFFKNTFAWTMKAGHDNTLLIVTTVGVLVFDKQLKQYRLIDAKKEINDVDVMPNAQLLLVTNNGLYRYNPQNQSTSQIPLPVDGDSIKQPRVYCMSNVVQSIRFFCARSGLYYTVNGQYFFISNQALDLPSPAIKVTINKSNELWIATFDGSFTKQLNLNQLSNALHDNTLVQLTGHKVNAILHDKDDVIWVASMRSGLI